MPLEEVLKLAFLYTDFHVSIDPGNKVFLTKGSFIITKLPIAGEVSKGDSFKGVKLSNLPADKEANTFFANEKLYQVGIKSSENKEINASVKVYVVSAKTKEPLPVSSIYVDDKIAIASTDSNGFYRFNLTKGPHTLTINSFGKRQAIRRLIVNANGTLPIELEDDIRVLQNVLISAQRNTNVNSAQMGVEKLNIRSIKQVPVIFGEADVLRVILTLPGVKSTGEASTGFNVEVGVLIKILFSLMMPPSTIHLTFLVSFLPLILKL